MFNWAHFQTIAACRDFFKKQNFLETMTPPMVLNPGMETHLHPFRVTREIDGKKTSYFLHTSPEFHLKNLLSHGHEKIYSLSYCFRDEPESTTHRPQFLMLEWYRANSYYHVILKDTLELIEFVRSYLAEKNVKTIEKLIPRKTTVDELFNEYLSFSILNFLDANSLKEKIILDFPDLVTDSFDDWPFEDYFYLLFLNKIEPHFINFPLLVVDEFPTPLAALSTIKTSNPKVCERFEIYLRGVELCNCFNELTNLQEQRKRMSDEKMKKKDLYGYYLPDPKILYEALERGLPPSSGIALGVERLLLGLVRDQRNFNPFYL